jgi:phosphatidyl-myo-inositol dimannoside synthase
VKHLFVTQDYGPDLGGMARRHVELCRRFAPDTVVVSTVASSGGSAFDRAEGYPIVRERFPFAEANRFVNQLRWARSLKRIGRDGVRLMHCGNIRPCGYSVHWTHKRARLPYLVYVNGGDLLRERRKIGESALKRATARQILGDAAGIVATSRWCAGVARELLVALGVRTNVPVAAIDLGTDPSHFSPAMNQGLVRRRFALGDGPLMLTVARLVPHKGQDIGIRALARLGREHAAARYLLVGEGHDEARLRALAAELGVADRVIFAGPLTDTEVADAYATATVYVGLSRLDREVNVEGFGIAFVEAAASGVPSIAGDSGGVASAVRDGETGILVPPEDVEAVVDALGSLFADASLRGRMGAAGRRAVETHYNWDRTARETLSFAHAAVEGARR